MFRGIFLVAALGISIATGDKTPKAFSLFNVVTFKNERCLANAANNLMGTCYTTEECEENGGTASGGCAMGFGTCCLFATDECDSTVSENCTYVRNTGFPTALTGVAGTALPACTFTVNKCAEEVCSLRLDFRAFNIQAGTAAASATAQDSVAACADTFTVTTANDPLMALRPLCGNNQGQHLYVEIGDDATVGATLAFAFANAAGTRQFEIKITQFACGGMNTPPGGCLQYHTGTTGQLTTFNWGANALHLPNQLYDICIRQEEGFCCVEYSVCAQPGAFSLSVPSAKAATAAAQAAAAVAKSGALCGGVAAAGAVGAGTNTIDYISIDGGSEVCGSLVSSNRFCGDVFATGDGMVMAAIDNIICDCSPPFVVGIYTSPAIDAMMMAIEDDAAGGAPQQSRGLCLDYIQRPCS